MVVVEQKKKDGYCAPDTPGKAGVKKGDRNILTTADLVLLSLLAEQPMHGYQANAEMERREVRDWAGISRPQVYYSLEKLARLRMLRAATTGKPAEGPERAIFAITGKGKTSLADALERQDWTVQREKPAFLTWMALSWQARKGVFVKQLQSREDFLKKELHREHATLASVLDEVGHANHEAVWMLNLMIAQFETELRWLARVRRGARRRTAAKHPALVSS
jgi:DNA-binding PadR family transcriptional regulator